MPAVAQRLSRWHANSDTRSDTMRGVRKRGAFLMPDITLYFAPASRAFTPHWLLEELEVPYKVRTISLRKGAQKSPQYLHINSMGKVPALRDGHVTVSESPAICIYLADRYSLGNLGGTTASSSCTTPPSWQKRECGALPPESPVRKSPPILQERNLTAAQPRRARRQRNCRCTRYSP